MTDQKSEKLKKRVLVDFIASLGIASTAVYMIAIRLFTFVMMISIPSSYDAEAKVALSDVVCSALICLIFILLSTILYDIREDGKPFTKSNISKLRAISILVMLCGVVPKLFAEVVGFVFWEQAFEVTFNTQWLVPGFLGMVIGIVSEVFYYGYELQDEMDSIA